MHELTLLADHIIQPTNCHSIMSLTRSTSSRRLPRRVPHARRGVAALEFALVAGPLFLLIFGSIEIGRAMMAVQSLEEASRAGCRTAVLANATAADVEAKIDELLRLSNIRKYTVTVTPALPAASPAQWEPVTVTITAKFDDVSWLPLPNWVKTKTLTGICTLPREGVGKAKK